MDDHNHTKELKPTVENLSKAIYTVNRHAKTATNPKYLYLLKRKLCKSCLMKEKVKGRPAFSKNPRFSQQQSDVLISLGDYFFTCLQQKKTSQTFHT